MEGKGFNWGALGKPDYAQAGAIVDSLPESIRRKLKNDMREVMQNMFFLGWQQAVKSGRGVAYCWPTEGWFAKKLGKSVRTVQRCLVRLKEAGLVEWRNRKTRAGLWTSNLFTLGKSLMASLFARIGKKVQRKRDTTKVSYNDLKREYKLPPSTREASLIDTLQAKLRDVKPRLDGVHGVHALEPVERKETSAIDRKALLKMQAEHLKARGL